MTDLTQGNRGMLRGFVLTSQAMRKLSLTFQSHPKTYCTYQMHSDRREFFQNTLSEELLLGIKAKRLVYIYDKISDHVYVQFAF